MPALRGHCIANVYNVILASAPGDPPPDLELGPRRGDIVGPLAGG